MVYTMLEVLAGVFAVLVFATLAFILCATVLLAQEALAHGSRALHKAVGGQTSQFVAGFRGHAQEGGIDVTKWWNSHLNIDAPKARLGAFSKR